MDNNQELDELDIKFLNGLCNLIANTQLDIYVLENIVSDVYQPNDRFDIYSALKDMNLSYIFDEIKPESFAGIFFDSAGNITNRSKDDLTFEFYTNKIELMFYDEISKSNKRLSSEYLPFKPSLRSYLLDAYNIFKEIVNIQLPNVSHDYIMPFNNQSIRRKYFAQLSKFVVAIKLKHLRQGNCVNRYIKDIPFLPKPVKRLVKKQNNNYILLNSDTDSNDYKLALFSCIYFIKQENYSLFELKSEYWRNCAK